MPSDRTTPYTAREVADLRRCSLSTVYRWVGDGSLRPLRRKPGGPLLFAPSVVTSFAEVDGMGARFREDNGWWYCDFWVTHHDGRRERIRRYPPANTRKSALEHERKIRAEIAAGTWRQAEPPTLRTFAKAFIADAKAQLKPSTVHVYEVMLDQHLLPRWGRRVLDTIGPADIATFKQAQLEAGSSKKTINNQLALLSSMLRRAVEWGELRQAPRVQLFKLMRVQDREYRWLSRTEAEAVIEAATGYWPAVITVALHTGMRLGELQALRWSDVDMKRGKITVRRSYWNGEIGTPKSGKAREIPINRSCRRALENHPPLLRCELVFHTRKGSVIKAQDMSKGLRRVCVAAEVDPFGWHVLRHTFASWLVERSVPIRTVQMLLGHSTVAVTERYAHVAPASGLDAVAVLEG